MRVAVFLATVILGVTATPNGFYHQQYNYKTSSSSYKNNELQHKTDDQGYYSKDGDLEGRVKPKVSSNSEHSEYVNPQLREGLNAGYVDAGTDLTSHGNMLANSYGGTIGGGVSSGYSAGSQYGTDSYSEGLASSDHIAGATGAFGAYGSGSSQSSYGSGSSQSSYGSSSLRTVGSRLQNDLQQEIQEALRSQSRYSHQIDISELEAELHRNLTSRLNTILQEQYGTQTIRGGQSYSLTGGRLQTRPNYEQHDLENLQKQVENSLLQKLRYDYSHGASHSGNQIYNENYARYESTTTYRPTTYRPIYPNLNVITTPRPIPEYPGGSRDSYYSQNEYNVNRVSSNVRYTPVPNPLSITTIASNVQSQLDSQLNRLLEQAQTQYFSENSGYSVHNLDSVLETLRQELKNNLTYILDEELRGQYGTQTQKNNYMFSVGSGGQISGQYNYNVADLENLRRQVESNLVTKLNRDFESARQRWISRQQLVQQNNYERSQSNDYRYGSSSNNQRFEYSTPRYIDNDYYRPTSASIVPLITTGVKGNQYHTISGSQQSNYGSSGSTSNIVELQRQLQSDLSRQVQAAIGQNKAYTSRYSTNGGYGGSYEEAYQRLYNELQRNLTQQIQEYEAGSSGYSNSYGSVSDAQLASLKSQLQRNLASQLQSGLQQSYSASASYSASSGSSASSGAGAYSSSSSDGAYRATRGSQAGYSGYGQYRSGGSYPLEGEDCQDDDTNAYRNYRTKRSYGYRSRPLGLSTHSGSGYGGSGNEGYNTGYNGYFGGYNSGDYTGSSSLYGQQPHRSVGQEVDESDTIQQVEPLDESTGQRQIDVGQQVDDSDYTQQVEIDNGFGKIEFGSQNKLEASDQRHEQLGQENYSVQGAGSSDGKLQNGIQSSQSNPKPNSQGTGLYTYGQRELRSQNHVGQQVDLTQQQEYIGPGYFQHNPSYTRNPNIGTIGNLQTQSHVGQEVDDTDLTQNTEDINFENPYPKHNRYPFGSDSSIGTSEVASSHLSNFNNVASQIQSTTKRSLIQHESHYIGQEIDDSDLTQQTEDTHFENAQPKFDRKPFESDSNIGTSKVASSHLPKFSNVISEIHSTTKRSLIGQPEPHYIGQEIDDSDLTQQAEDIHFENSPPKYNRKPFGFDLSVGTTEAASSHLSNFGSVTSQVQSSTKRSLIGQFEQQYIGQEIDDSDTTHQESQYSDSGTLAVGPLIQTSTKKPQLPVGSNFDYPRPKYENIESNSQYKPVNQKAEHSDTFRQTNKLQNSRKVGGDADLTQELENTSFSTIGKSVHNNQETAQPEQNGDSNYNMPFTYSLSTMNLPTAVKNVFKEVETNLTKQLESTINNDISYSIAPSQLYQNILRKWQNNINIECQKLLKYHSYYLKIDQNKVNQLETYLKLSLEEKLQKELQKYGFSRENLGISNIEQPQQPSLNSQNTNVENDFHYGGDHRYHQYSRGYLPKPVSSNDFIQREINSQDGRNTNTDPQFINQYPNPLPTLSQVNEDNRQFYGTQYISRAHNTYPNRKPWSNGANYPEYTAGTPQNIPLKPLLPKINQNLNGDSESSLIPDRPYDDPIVNIGNVTPKDQVILEIGPPGYVPFTDLELNQKPLQQSNTQWTNIEPLDSVTTSVDNQEVDYEITSPSKPNEGKNPLLTASNTNHINPLDLSNFPPLPPPRNSASVIPPSQIAQEPSSTPTLTNWQGNLNEGKQRQQSLADAEREADLLIEKLKAAQQNRQTQHVNINEQGSVNSYHGSRTSYHRTTQNSPSDYNIIQLENINTEQFKIINQIDEYFTKIIEAAVEDELKIAEGYQQSLKNLETKLKINLTESIKGEVHSHLGVSDVDLKMYSDLINQNFEEKKIPDLYKYLEIKLVKKLREQLIKAYKVDNAENVYNFQYDIRTQPERTPYRPRAEHEVIQIKLENLTKGQTKIINNMEDDFRKQIEEAIQTHLASVTSGYLYSYENYQKSFIELEAQLKNNITECVQGASEPGLSKYSDLILEKFDQRKIIKLEEYLKVKLSKNLRESLKTHFKFNVAYNTSFGSNLRTSSLNSNSGYQNYQINHGYEVPYTSNTNTDSEKTLEIEPIEYQHATLVIPPPPPYSGGVKGGKASQSHLETPLIHPSYSNQNGNHNIESLTEPVEIINPDELGISTTEKGGWWQRFGNKVKQGAANLKKKIVGTS